MSYLLNARNHSADVLRRSDPYARLRVPRYLKAFEVVFFAVLLALYYAVLVQRNFDSISTTEIFLYIFLAGFAYDECESI